MRQTPVIHERSTAAQSKEKKAAVRKRPVERRQRKWSPDKKAKSGRETEIEVPRDVMEEDSANIVEQLLEIYNDFRPSGKIAMTPKDKQKVIVLPSTPKTRNAGAQKIQVGLGAVTTENIRKE